MLLYIVYIYMKSSIKYLLLSAVATTLISSAALVYAWVGPTGNPLVNNVAAPINVGSVSQQKNGVLTVNALQVSGSIVNTAAYTTNNNLSGYNVGVGTIGAGTSIYSYGSICTGNGNYDCSGVNGVVTGPINTAAQVNLTTGNSFFNGGNVGIGTTAPSSKLQVGVLSNTTDGITVFAGDGRSMRFSPSPGVGAWNSLVQAGDQSFIFSNGTPGTGNLTIAPWTTAANAGLRMTAAGDVGIGTTTPASKLGVQGAITAAGTIRSSTGGFQFPDGSTQTTAASAGQWTTTGANISNSNSGNVGIGLTNPANKLEVLGSIQAIGATSSVGTGAGSFLSYVGTTNYLRGNTYFNGVLYDETNSTYYLDPSGNSVFSNVYSDAYYDRNNNGYYVDGNNTSVLNSIQSRNFVDLDNTGYYVDGNNTSVFNAVNAIGYFLTDNTAPTTYFRDTDGRGAILHNNSNQFYIVGTPTSNSTGFGLNGSNYPLVIDLTNDNITLGGNIIVPEGNVGIRTGGAALYPFLAVNASGLIGSANQTYDIAAGSIAAGKSIYSYDKICAGNGAGNCEGTGGMVMSTTNLKFPDGTTQTTAASAGQWTTTGNDIRNSNTGGVGIGGIVTATDQRLYVQSTGTQGAAAFSSAAGVTHIGYGGTTNYLRGNTIFNGILTDEDNSAYYMNPNGTSIFNDLRSNIFYDNNNTSFYLDPNGASNLSSATVGTIYSSNWFRSQGATGWYNEAYGTGLYSDETGFMRGYGATGLKLYGALSAPTLTTTGTIQSASTIRSTAGGFIFPDNTVQTTAATAVVPGNFIANGTTAQTANANITGSFQSGSVTTGSSTVNGQSTFNAVNGQSIIGYTVNNNNYLRGNTLFNGVLYDENNLAYYVDPSSVSAFQDIRPSIIYDRDDTNFYLNPNGSSVLDVSYQSFIYDRNNTAYYLDPSSVSAVQDMRPSVMYDRDNTDFYIDMNAASNIYGLTVSTTGNFGGNVTAPAFIYLSDRSLKDNITPLQSSLAKIRSMQGYTFNWKETRRADIGVIAQEVEQVYPTLVHTDAKTGLKSVEYGNLVAPLIEAVKELAAMFDSLAARVFNTETRQTELEKQNQVQAEQIAELQKQIKTLQLAK
jgi:hypothetical protein